MASYQNVWLQLWLKKSYPNRQFLAETWVNDSVPDYQVTNDTLKKYGGGRYELIVADRMGYHVLTREFDIPGETKIDFANGEIHLRAPTSIPLVGLKPTVVVNHAAIAAPAPKQTLKEQLAEIETEYAKKKQKLVGEPSLRSYASNKDIRFDNAGQLVVGTQPNRLKLGKDKVQQRKFSFLKTATASFFRVAAITLVAAAASLGVFYATVGVNPLSSLTDQKLGYQDYFDSLNDSILKSSEENQTRLPQVFQGFRAPVKSSCLGNNRESTGFVFPSPNAFESPPTVIPGDVVDWLNPFEQPSQAQENPGHCEGCRTTREH